MNNHDEYQDESTDEGWGLVVFAVGTGFAIGGLVLGAVLSVLLMG